MTLKDNVAIVTGGARGIGKAICRRLAAEGAAIAVVDIRRELAEETAGELAEDGTNAAAFEANVADSDSVAAMVKEVMETFGRIDILVNNAGITRDNLFIRLKDEDWDSVLAVNLKGVYNCTKAVARPMMKARSGRIVNIASVVGIIGNAGQANYAASKAGVIGLTKTVARELAHVLSEEARDAFLRNIPLARGGTPEDVAGVVCFLAGPDAAYMTGQTLCIDGGMVMQ
jgi:3-oxoacyl-[acyl-carrier protein] reductase